MYPWKFAVFCSARPTRLDWSQRLYPVFLSQAAAPAGAVSIFCRQTAKPVSCTLAPGCFFRIVSMVRENPLPPWEQKGMMVFCRRDPAVRGTCRGSWAISPPVGVSGEERVRRREIGCRRYFRTYVTGLFLLSQTDKRPVFPGVGGNRFEAEEAAACLLPDGMATYCVFPGAFPSTTTVLFSSSRVICKGLSVSGMEK